MTHKSTLLLGAAAIVAASNLFGIGDVLGPKLADVTACDSTGVKLGYELSHDRATSGPKVTGIRVTGIADDCADRHVKVTVADADGAELVDASAAVTGTEMLLQVPPTVPDQIYTASVTISS